MGKINLKKNDIFYWEKCHDFERKTISEFADPIRTFIGVYDCEVLLIENLDEQLEGKDIEVNIPRDDPIRYIETITFECKNDTHIHSPNFFFEDVSNTVTNAIGWTLKSKADFLAYGFYDLQKKYLKKVYFMDMNRLSTWFDGNYHQFDPKMIKNNGYYTIGRAVPIELMWELGIIEFRAERGTQNEEMFS